MSDIKIFMTGDNHFGKKYDRYPQAKEALIESRFTALERMIQKAEEEGCGIFAVTGDLFDNINNIKVSDVKRVAVILARFGGSVLVLPGNHDYYTGEEKVWIDFEKALSTMDHNITLLKEYRTYEFEVGDEKVIVYPAFCDSKHSKENKLGWIKEADIDIREVFNIGIAHGAIKGVTPDLKEEYFLMTETELKAIQMDAWLIGHTHIMYPGDLSEDEDAVGYRIFNAGTHAQTDLHNNTEGNGFILTIEKNGTNFKTYAKRFVSGDIRFYDLKVVVEPDSEKALSEAILAATRKLGKKSILRLTLSGSVKPTEYQDKEKMYQDLLGGYLAYEVEDRELSEEITIDKIRSEFAETSFASKMLEELMDNPTELQMAYQLILECKE